MKKQVIFLGELCNISMAQYDNGRVAIELIIAETGEPMAVATVNIPQERLGNNQVIIKDYSENEGMLKVLVDAGIVSKPKRAAKSGHIIAPVCDLLVDVKDYSTPFTDEEESDIEDFIAYSVGIVCMSCCVPKDMERSKVEQLANIYQPTGIDSKWVISEEDFKTGAKNGCACEQHPQDRVHYLLNC